MANNKYTHIKPLSLQLLNKCVISCWVCLHI